MTWSKSQVANLKECRRKYFFSKVLPDDVQPLKKLQSRYLWGGSIVHETIGTLLKLARQGEILPPLDQTIADVRARMRKEFLQSKETVIANAKMSLRAQRSNLSQQEISNSNVVSEQQIASVAEKRSFAMTGHIPHNDNFMLFEHAYHLQINQDAWKSQWAGVEKSLAWFYGSRWLSRFQELEPHTWKAVDELLNFEVDGVKAYVKMDCALETNNRFVLIDWKTSTPKPSDEFSLHVMALYAHDVWNADAEAIDAMSVSLLDGRQFKATISEDSLMETQIRIQEETTFLNEEAAQHETYADYRAAPMTSDIGTCLRCNFQKICHPAGVSMAYAV